jgi:hypothetical protein
MIPYYGMENTEAVEKIITGNVPIKLSRNNFQGYRLPKPKNTPEKVYAVMMQCWNLDPNIRPSFEDILEKFSEFSSKKVIIQNPRKPTANTQIIYHQ